MPNLYPSKNAFMSKIYFFLDIVNIAMHTKLIQNRHNIGRYLTDIELTLSKWSIFL